MDEKLKNKLREFRINILTFLHTLATTDSIALDERQISDSTGTANEDILGIVITLRRIKVNGESIIQKAGRDNEGRYRWRINEPAISKKELSEFLEKEILGKEGLHVAEN